MARGPYHISDDEHGPYVVVFAALLMTYTILCFIARLVMRFTINGPLGADDWTVAAGSIIAVIQSALKISEARHGLGKRTDAVGLDDIEAIGKLSFAGDILYIAGMALSRAASFLLIARLTRQTHHARAAYVGVLITGVLGFVSMFVLGLRCNFAPWRIVPKCSETTTRWYIIEGLGTFVELIAAWIPIYLVWSLRMRLKAKFVVLFAFSFRLPVFVIIAFRLYYLWRESVRNDPLFYGADSSVFLEAALHYGLMAATIPCLKPFVKAFNTGWFDTRGVDTSLHSDGYALSNLNRTKYSANAEIVSGSDEIDNLESIPRGRLRQRGSDTPSSAGSDIMIIRRTKAWNVSYENDDAAVLK
ncbi:uncharacterized protein CIMG_01768 [Coccidioides immitis RS]|uniref:Rhodopsin domain-containing protein n=4 Tax=Coccidioides immitis TaxID=5501 RepID=A0A0E1RYP4_COCIM|nr:uncharacterized protein CIMG_01768 [Coccidioides immitis RS]EAS36414.2 hypothetical protein CIMG_01768 [Coccidioides immitis RS]KMP01772.1 hypothetical protein CIRG_01911 [Coccidioides immitis RMSCC 2394]KMU76244.1 hypothetical protein CISG_00979 [Coccidioides immitis RMSCC 3703]TPX25453.1 hypothetical protein DIZ76_010908 [Coccidioides immitis]